MPDADRHAQRVVAGVALIGLAAGGVIDVWGCIGIVPLLTGLFSVGPAYTRFGLSTCPMDKR